MAFEMNFNYYMSLQIKEFVNKTLLELNQRLRAAGDFLVNAIKVEISLAYPPASRAGEPPRYRTGELIESIHWIDAPNGYPRIFVGSTCLYASCLEDGTVNMAARPIFWKTTYGAMPTIIRLLGKPYVD